MENLYTKIQAQKANLILKNGSLSAPTKRALRLLDNARRNYRNRGTPVSRTSYYKALENAHYEMKRNRKLIRMLNSQKTPLHSAINAYNKVRSTHKKENYNKFAELIKVKPGLFWW